MGRLVVSVGDITGSAAEAIVNPANSSGAMGGGAALAIRKAGGRRIESEAVAQAPIPVGRAVITSAGRLKAAWVIHAPTMEMPSMRIPAGNAAIATAAALELASRKGIRSVAIPGMGTGTGGLRPGEAARAMLGEILKRLGSFDAVYVTDTSPGFIGAFRKLC